MNRHERRKSRVLGVRRMEIPASALDRVQHFLNCFRDAPNDADIEIRIGHEEHGAPAILISFTGTEHALRVTEARKVADIMEETMNEFPDQGVELENIIMGMRAACDKADTAFSLS